MNKLSIFALSVVVSASLIAGPLAAEQIVVSPRDRSAFVERVEGDLANQLGKIRFDPRWDESGTTSVRFTSGIDGRPDNVTTFRSSGSARLDRQTRDAVSRLTSLGALPSDLRSGQQFQANIIVASTHAESVRLAKKMQKAEEQRLASSPGERAVLAFASTTRRAS